jgi:hypothetical protein
MFINPNQVFTLQGKRIELTLVHNYFPIGIPMYGVGKDILPVMPQGRKLYDFIE